MSQKLAVDHNRRYVGTKETIGYVLYDSSKTINIEAYSQRFMLDVVKISFIKQSQIELINGIWDIINDGLIGILVDKTRTRIGKFRPYLLAFAIPCTLGSIFYWLTPMFFGPNPENMAKFFYWLVLSVVNEATGTFRSISDNGMLATITPNPNERVRLISVAEVSSSLYENFPEWGFGILIDLINHKKVNIPLKNAFVNCGIFTTVLSSFFAIYFFLITKERIPQNVERPRLIEGIRSIINNKPMLMVMLSEVLDALKISTNWNNYYVDVLGTISIKTIIGLPGAPFSFLSYAYVNWAKRKFSTKSLWVVGQHMINVLDLGVFLIGSMGGKGPKGLFRNPRVMIPVLMFKEVGRMSVLSLKKIIPREIFNESMDYCEWVNGYRSEGMTIAAKDMIRKIVNRAISVFNTLMMKRIGYSLSADFGGQSDSTKYWIFVLCTLLPTATSIFSVIPKLCYSLGADKREIMYKELSERREHLRLSLGETE